jgi:ribosomal protein L24E
MDINTISDFRKAMRNGPYAWPGGYPLYFITKDGAALSFKSAKAERRYILEAIRDNDNSGWNVIAMDINWEDAELTCDHSGERIESAYAD